MDGYSEIYECGIVAKFRNCRDLIGEGEVFANNKSKVASGLGCVESGVVYVVF